MNRHIRSWEHWGECDPYFAVLAHPWYRRAELSAETSTEFFAEGERDIAHIFDVLKQWNPDFSPTSALDYGCGVARLLIPLAERCPGVTGVDVSHSMLAEARKNLESRGLSARLLDTQELKQLPSSSFDFVNSLIVLQHIPAREGEKIFLRLIELLRPGGMASIHFTFSHHAARWRRACSWMRKNTPIHYPLNLLQGKSWSEPRFEMHYYSLNRMFTLLFSLGIRKVYSEMGWQGDKRGIQLFFAKT